MAGDVYYKSVGLLLPMNGSNGGTSFTDYSTPAKTATGHGNAQTSTAQSLWGGSSALFDGNGDYLSVPYSSTFDGFNTGDFSIDAVVYPTAVDSYPQSVVVSAGGGAVEWNSTTGIHWLLTILASGTFQLQYWSGAAMVNVDLPLAVTLNAWNTLRVYKQGSTVFLGANDLTMSAAIAAIARPSTNPEINVATIVGGAATGTYDFIGHIQSIRLTKGISRDVAINPTEAFPTYLEPASLDVRRINSPIIQSFNPTIFNG